MTPLAPPSSLGVDPAAVRTFIEAAQEAAEIHTLAISRAGVTVTEAAWVPYSLGTPRLVYSISKTITAMAVGALSGRAFELTDRIIDNLPVDPGTLDPRWREVTIAHCLSMATGHTADAWKPEWGTGLPRDTPLLRAVLAHPPEVRPGTVFAYNQVATYLLSRAVTHATGLPLRRVVHERVLCQLGMDEPGWLTDAGGFDQGWSGAYVPTGDLLRLGEFWLRDGRAPDGRRLLPEGFLAQATTAHTTLPADRPSDSWTRGYGYSFWLLDAGFRADGAFGQFVVVVPEADLVISLTSISDDMHRLGRLILTHLLPGVGALPPDRTGSTDDDAALASFLAGRCLPLLPVDGVAPAAGCVALPLDGAGAPGAPVSGIDHVRAPSRPGEALRLSYAGTDLEVAVPSDSWAETRLLGPSGPYAGLPLTVLAQGGWHRGTYTARLRLPGSPHHILVATDGAGRAAATWPIAPLHGTDPFAASPVRAESHRAAPHERHPRDD